VRAFGRAFTVSLEAGQWSWVNQHGWAYEARCDTAVQRAVVPALYHEALGFAQLHCGSQRPPSQQTCHGYQFFGFALQRCDEPITHIWRGRWTGSAARLRLYFSGQATVETTRGLLIEQRGEEVAVDFPVSPGDVLRVTLVTPPLESAPQARIMEITAATERVPLWESVEPIADASDGAAATGTGGSPTP